MNKLDLFNNYSLQREELLARIAQSLQLDESRWRRMESAYRSIATLIDNDQGFFKDINVDVYPQGSVAIGATVKPLHGNEFDLDIVVHVKKQFLSFSPSQIYNELLKILESDERYRNKIIKKKRCVRLNYANDFHMDIMPGCIKLVIDDNNIKVPDRELKDWVDGNPRDFSKWFLDKSKIRQLSLLEAYNLNLKALRAEVEDLPEDEFYLKTPLQRALQLVKRYRDIYFEKENTFATSSIVITTLMGRFYQGENSIYDTLNNIVQRIRQDYQLAINSGYKFKILNPVNANEEFTDKWSDAHYRHFYLFIDDFYNKWKSLQEKFEKSSSDYIRLFGEGTYKQSLQSQIKQMGRFSADNLSVANGLILGGKAHTNSYGQTTSNSGYKNVAHHNFGQ